MLGAAAAIGIWSAVTGAAFSTTIIRIVITLVAFQLAYFAVLMVVGFLPSRTSEDAEPTTDAPQGSTAKVVAENND